MSAERYSTEVLQMFSGPITEQENADLPQPLQPDVVVIEDIFILTRRGFGYGKWLYLKKENTTMTFLCSQEKTKKSSVVKNDIRELRRVKVSFGLLEIQTMEHYFQEHEPLVFTRYDEDHIKIEFDRFVETMKGEIEAWSARGSGWVLERIMVAYVNVARYQPLRGGTYLDLPQKLKSKKAIINVQNRDNECLKWALRAALFPSKDGKNLQMPSNIRLVMV